MSPVTVSDYTFTMKLQPTLKAYDSLSTRQSGGTSARTGEMKLLPASVAHQMGCPAFSNESSETEYTSSDPSGDTPHSEHEDFSISAHKGEPVHSDGWFQAGDKSSTTALENSSNLYVSDGRKIDKIGRDISVRTSCPCSPGRHTCTPSLKMPQDFQCDELASHRGQPVAEFSHIVRSPKQQMPVGPLYNAGKVMRTKKERYEKEANGNVRVVVDLNDLDVEDLNPTLTQSKDRYPLCHSCLALQNNKKQDIQLEKGCDKKSFLSSKMTLVVDLSEIPRMVDIPSNSSGDSTPPGGRLTSVHVQPRINVKAEKHEHETKPKLEGDPVETSNVLSQKLSSGSRFRNLVTNKTSRIVRRLVPLEEEKRKTKNQGSRKEDSEDEASTLSDLYKRKHGEDYDTDVILPDWSPDVVCDLCERGPSLSLGAWYSWCCGAPSRACKCASDEIVRKKVTLKWKSGKNWKKSYPMYPWSGKVHRLCALWSCEVLSKTELLLCMRDVPEVYEAEGPIRMVELMSAVQRSKKIKCSDAGCGLFGATLGCRVKRCKKNYHYPCADRLSVNLKVRMWDGLKLPIACKEHRHVNEVCELKPKKKRKKGGKGGSKGRDTQEFLVFENKSDAIDSGNWKRSKSAGMDFGKSQNFREIFNGVGTSKQGIKTPSGANVIDLLSSDEERSPNGHTSQDWISHSSTHDGTGPRYESVGGFGMPHSWPEPLNSKPGYLGKKLLCRDFSGGKEPIVVPCTNDVDDEAPPYLQYITKSRYQGLPLGSKGCSHPLLKKLANACQGCTLFDPDDPSAPVSVHVQTQHREQDHREDWQKERMNGRLPYDNYARLMIGTDYNELVECNDRCACGDSCINREMQKGLRTAIELYKSINKGWAVRTLESIPRGRFVIEYVGEMLTQDQAHEYGQLYDEIKRSYLYDLDYPGSNCKPVFTLDGFHASNVARFINHSCDANLKIFRVYVETTNKWLSHIGMYAMRDIEAGEELSYDYNYGMNDLKGQDVDNTNDVTGEWQSHPFSDDQENDSTHIKCYCGARNCRKWLWRPLFVDTDSEDEAGQKESKKDG